MEKDAEEFPRLPDWRFFSILEILRALYDCGERKVSDFLTVNMMLCSEKLGKIYRDISVVEVPGLDDEVAYSGLIHEDLQHLVEIGVLKETKVMENWKSEVVKELDGYDITQEGLKKGYMVLEKLGYPVKSVLWR